MSGGAVRFRQFNMAAATGGLTNNLLSSCMAAYLAALSFGYMIGYSSPALPQMMPPGGPLDDDSASWFSSIATIGAIFGCICGGWLVDRLGRRPAVLTSALPFMLGHAMVWLGGSVMVLCTGRFLTGLASGMSTVICPLYLAELAPKHLRGMLGSGGQLAITIGILLVYLLGMMCGWRTLAAIGAVLPVGAVLCGLRAPESPRYTLARGGEVTRVLQWLRPPGTDVQPELQEMETSIAEDKQEKPLSLADLIHTPSLYKPLKVSAAIMILQQLSGINVIMFYTVSIFQSAGFEKNGELATVAVGVTQVGMTVVACMLMDRLGRRRLLIIAGLGMGLCCGLLAYYYHCVDNGTAGGLSWLALTALLLYIVFFSLGWGPIPMLIMSEVLPTRAKGPAGAVAAVTSWSTAFLVTKEYSTIQLALGMSGAFWLFCAFCVLGVVYVYKAVPETRGKSLEDIQAHFAASASSSSTTGLI